MPPYTIVFELTKTWDRMEWERVERFVIFRLSMKKFDLEFKMPK